MKKKLIAVISGASSGIGKEVSILLAENGYHVILLSRKIKLLKRISNKIKKNGGLSDYFKCDISNYINLKNVKKKIDKIGEVDIVINNAGVGLFSKLEEIKYADWMLQINVNLTGSFLISQAFLKNMKKRKEGSIVFINSIAGKYGFPFSAAYVASKFGLRGLADSMRNELREDNIRVISIYPGAVDTPFWKDKELDFDTKKMLDCKDVASAIMNAIKANKNTVYEDLVIRGISGNL